MNFDYGLALLFFTCAVLAAKWASDQGFRQTRQVLWGIAGLLFGPLPLLILYVQFVRKYQAAGLAAGRW
jgi:hypothetical protein